MSILMQNLLLALLVIIVIIGVACNSSKKTTGNGENPTPEAPDPYAPTLHDIWVLETMDGQALDRGKKRPQIELFPGEGRVSGNGGCNQMFGQMEASGWQIAFSNLGTTKMFCRDMMETESQFLQLLGEVDQYRIKELKLILLKDDEPRLIFQKVD